MGKRNFQNSIIATAVSSPITKASMTIESGRRLNADVGISFGDLLDNVCFLSGQELC